MPKTRARSPEKKAEKFREIIKEGRKLFLKFGSEGFSMRAIAKNTGMQQGNLYNYVQSKRELWFAVIQEDFQHFTERMKQVTETHQGSAIKLLEKIAECYFDFAVEDTERYKMMFLTPAPPSSSIGPIESYYQPESFEIILQTVQTAIEQKELVDVEPLNFTLFLWGIVHGNVSLLQPEYLFPQQYAQNLNYQEGYQKFFMKQIEEILEYYSRKSKDKN
ncbi:MAG: TetR/AcrR family transcriptional regulator [Candidatus Heimdallarchaeota archaeon]